MIRILVIIPTPQVFGLQVATFSFFKDLDRTQFEPVFLVSRWNDGSFVNRLKELGLPYEFSYLGFLSMQLTARSIDMTLTCLFYLPRLFLDLRRLMKKYHFDVIYIAGYHLIIQVFPVLLMWRKPVLCHVHDYYSDSKFHRLLHRGLDLVITRYVAVSEAVRFRLTTLGIKADKIQTIHNGLDFSRFHSDEPSPDIIRKRYGWQSSDAIVAFVGQLIEQKGVTDFVLAAKAVCDQDCSIKFVIVGKTDGDYYSKLRDLVSVLGLVDRVVFWGFEREENIPSIFQSIDVVVMPSRGEEAFGLVLAESMAAGKPVVVARGESTNELINNGEEGIVVEKADPSSIATAIMFLISNPDAAKRMGGRGRERVRTMFSIREQTDLLSGCIAGLVEQKGQEATPVS